MSSTCCVTTYSLLLNPTSMANSGRKSKKRARVDASDKSGGGEDSASKSGKSRTTSPEPVVDTKAKFDLKWDTKNRTKEQVLSMYSFYNI